MSPRSAAAMARRAAGFGMKVIYSDSFRLAGGAEKSLSLTYVDKETLLRESDFVTLHVPLTPVTQHLIAARELRLMRPIAVLVNTSRGPVVDERALVRALEEKRIRGAALDVFEREPEVEPTLLGMRNVVLTPHLGSAVAELREQRRPRHE